MVIFFFFFFRKKTLSASLCCVCTCKYLNCIPVGAYFLSNSLCSNKRKYIVMHLVHLSLNSYGAPVRIGTIMPLTESRNVEFKKGGALYSQRNMKEVITTMCCHFKVIIFISANLQIWQCFFEFRRRSNILWSS